MKITTEDVAILSLSLSLGIIGLILYLSCPLYKNYVIIMIPLGFGYFVGYLSRLIKDALSGDKEK